MARAAIIGGGLAGCEAAWQLARFGVGVDLFEMKPERFSPAHKSPNFGELVCSNSLKSDNPKSATHLLKEEMRSLSSLVLSQAETCRVPAGSALAVDRELFSKGITDVIEKEPLINIIRKEVRDLNSLNSYDKVVIATGPLTSDLLAGDLAKLTGSDYLWFYDSIAPIIYADSIDREVVFEQDRYDEGTVPSVGGLSPCRGYLNCPLNSEEYLELVAGLLKGEKVETRGFETLEVFEGCLPIEVLAERGEMTLAFGPMRPVGLKDPRTGKRPFAVIQLRPENKEKTLYNMVGFQTRLKWPDQERVFRKVPGLRQARFARLGVMHRNTYIDSPRLLDSHLRLKRNERITFAGQITGVEGYVESAAVGMVAGRFAGCEILGKELEKYPAGTAMGALLGHLGNMEGEFKPMNMNWGLIGKITNNKHRGVGCGL